ncbi:uncharacterized protein LOC143028090 [Oratosquilla oratoria]|uniref:uncharacterized protein LOC143028090 n=1 Tax=Oratosquilla oratoria TaxID=337810 RepID=UPI003F76DB42
MGDLNAHVGTDRTGMQDVMGAFGIGDRNADSVFLTDFCLRNQMSIMNTYYEHQESHKWSWYIWNSEVGNYTEKSMIDFFVTNNKKLFRDVKSLPSVSLDSDHRLVLTKLTIKTLKRQRKVLRERFCLERLKERKVAEEFQSKIRNLKPDGNDIVDDIETEWEDFKSKEEIDERWREYFSELLGTTQEPQVQELGEEEGITTEEAINESSISRQEMKLALKEMKKGKSPGVDELPTELLSAGDNMIDWIHRLFSQVWKEGKAPEEWRKAIICPIYKKDDRGECTNYRGISLLSHTGKVYERIFEGRLRNSIEDVLNKCQCGFRSEA